MICRERGFIGLACKKCNEGILNIGIGLCLQCETSGPLGTYCQDYKQVRLRFIPIRRLNAKKSIIVECHDTDVEILWFSDVQKSFK